MNFALIIDGIGTNDMNSFYIENDQAYSFKDDKPYKIYFGDDLYKEFANMESRDKHLKTKMFERARKGKTFTLIPNNNN